MWSPLFRYLMVILGLLSPTAQGSEHFRIDPQHTFNTFEYRHWGSAAQRGRFDKSSGYIDIDLDNKSGHIVIEIDADSINTGSELFNKIMRSRSFFDTKQFQKITFNSTKLVFDADRLIQIEGWLIIKDRTEPVVIDITEFDCHSMMLYLKKACAANGQTKILRSDFDVDGYRPFVSNEVTLYFSVEGIKDE